MIHKSPLNLASLPLTMASIAACSCSARLYSKEFMIFSSRAFAFLRRMNFLDRRHNPELRLRRGSDVNVHVASGIDDHAVARAIARKKVRSLGEPGVEVPLKHRVEFPLGAFGS